jgi:hypothetical protein
MDSTNILVAACGSLLTFILLLLGVIGWVLKQALSKVEAKFVKIEGEIVQGKNDFVNAKVAILQKLDEYVNGYANMTSSELSKINDKLVNNDKRMDILEKKAKKFESKMKDNTCYSNSQ